MTNNTPPSIKDKVMSAIAHDAVAMRPRSHFVVLALLAAAAAILGVLSIMFLVSIALYFSRESGLLFATPFGSRGWWIFLHALPSLPLVLGLFFAVALLVLIRRYPAGYRTPVSLSFAALSAVVLVGGAAIGMTSLHHDLSIHGRHGDLSAPLGFIYGSSFRPTKPADVYHGVIDSRNGNTMVITDPDGDGTWSIHITPKTMRPYGEDFEKGDVVFVIGDKNASGTIEAFGIRVVEDLR